MTAYTELVEKAANLQGLLAICVKRLELLKDAKYVNVGFTDIKVSDSGGGYGAEELMNSHSMCQRIKTFLREDIEAEIRRISSDLSTLFALPVKVTCNYPIVEQPEPGNGEVTPCLVGASDE